MTQQNGNVTYYIFKDKDFYSLENYKVKSERVNTTTAKTQFDNISQYK